MVAPRLRRRIGEAAREEILARHTLAARRPLWEAVVDEAPGACVMEVSSAAGSGALG